MQSPMSVTSFAILFAFLRSSRSMSLPGTSTSPLQLSSATTPALTDKPSSSPASPTPRRTWLPHTQPWVSSNSAAESTQARALSVNSVLSPRMRVSVTSATQANFQVSSHLLEKLPSRSRSDAAQAINIAGQSRPVLKTGPGRHHVWVQDFLNALSSKPSDTAVSTQSHQRTLHTPKGGRRTAIPTDSYTSSRTTSFWQQEPPSITTQFAQKRSPGSQQTRSYLLSALAARGQPHKARRQVVSDALSDIVDDVDMTVYCVTEECVQLMQDYQQWKLQNGFGTVEGRWG